MGKSRKIVDNGFVGAMVLSFVTMVSLSFVWFSHPVPVYVVKDQADADAYTVIAGENLEIAREYCIEQRPPVDGWSTRTFTDKTGKVVFREEFLVDRAALKEGCYNRTTLVTIPPVLPAGNYTYVAATVYKVSPITTLRFAWDPIPVTVLPAPNRFAARTDK